ncbi:uncharacterized protein LOC110887874 [Helianthus annuus]|uniref:uncharacterized protein LOC110887874 n=1 Tax=Helianthus annuus TaxID=4232 RepID=UPI000B9089BB|nr:uncharacterized protein LOC110887874 [Helianthus annuus]
MEVEDMAFLIRCRAGDFPFNYLGLKVRANLNRVANWSPAYDIFEKTLSKCKAAQLSIEGKVTLIKAILESLPNYYFSLYKAPVKVINDLESKIRKILWGGDDVNNKLYWVAWNTRKEEGGGSGGGEEGGGSVVGEKGGGSGVGEEGEGCGSRGRMDVAAAAWRREAELGWRRGGGGDGGVLGFLCVFVISRKNERQ